MHWYRGVFVSSVVESVAFTGISAAVALIALVALQVSFMDVFGLVLLVLSSALMLIGGALSFITPGVGRAVSALTGSKIEPSSQDADKARNRAALYATTGVILFIESLVLAVALA